ncbi:unnamed protein product [Penicillium roqueforti FM164]|uniref:Uncharacterized protein n=1 Tax=Penicillium roqueforti (strain FM164) TaxID=1365484 RepID=W6QJF2_PENRF|nr:unnamed protein product [Penicillium roqueforti FM164]
MISFALVRPTYATAHDRIVLFVIVVNKWNRTINDLCAQVTKWSLVKANAICGAVDVECGID